MTIEELTATECARRIDAGELSSVELVRMCLERIGEVDGAVQAWAHLDHDHALRQAAARDEQRAAGRPTGPLHGVPVGIKDIIDTADMPTECGTPLMAGRMAAADAFVVSQLRQAGAVIMGKTVTTELAVYQPGKTTNPFDPARTPGGSSSGSAAAVATGMVPLAVGTQTNGSVIRPAAFCGVFGFKPTLGGISRTGVLRQSGHLDTLGVFARSIEDTAAIMACVGGFDDRDPAMKPRSLRGLRDIAASKPPIEPRIAIVKTPFWDAADDDTRNGFEELSAALGDNCEEVELPATFADALRWHRTIITADIAKSFAGHYERGRDQLSDQLREMIEEGHAVPAVDYIAAVDRIDVLYAGLAEIFEGYDAILTPAVTGQAPALDTTGDPRFCTLWTLTGTPAISLPLLAGADGLPIGVQLVGPRHDDARLLRTARWLVDAVAGSALQRNIRSRESPRDCFDRKPL